jgi:N-acetylmuramoyl-L-alanine amidase
MRTHIVKQGECLSSIAHAYGFRSYKKIYDDPANVEFRKRRPDPALLLPGDEIAIPTPEPTPLILATGKVHHIRVIVPVVQVRVRLRDRDGTPIAGEPYVLRWNGVDRKGKTAPDGLLSETLPASVEHVGIELTGLGFQVQLRCGGLDPIDTVSGAQQRLRNLGFGPATADGVFSDATRDAVQRFQETVDLTASGELDDETRQELLEAYGC